MRDILAGTVALVLTCAAFASGIDLHNVLAGHLITSWGPANGLPSGAVWALAQDRKGYLWLGTDAGLFRFDGQQFVDWRSETDGSLPEVAVRSLLITEDDTIWVGFGEPGGVSRIRGQEVVRFGANDGLGAGAVTVLLEDGRGHIWAASRSGLFDHDGNRWHMVQGAFASGAPYSGSLGPSGDIFLATATGVLSVDSQVNRLKPAEELERVVRHLTWDGAGNPWVSDPVAGFRRLHDPRTSGKELEKGQGSRLLFDGRGNLWVGTFGQGLWRIPSQSIADHPIIERTSTLTGLAADGVMALLEDREGNIWVGTNDGLNRLSPHKITPVLNLGIINGVEQTPDGSVWVGAVDALLQFPPGEATPIRHMAPLDGAPPRAMHSDGRGRLWIATVNGLLRFENGRATPIASSTDKHLSQISAIASDSTGALWLYGRDQGVVRWKEGTHESLELPASLRRAAVLSSLVHRQDRLWLSFENGSVLTVPIGTQPEPIQVSQGVDADVYRAIFEDHSGTVWLGGNHGLKRADGTRLIAVRTAAELPTSSIVGIIEDQSGNLWLGLQAAGVARIDREQIDRVTADPQHAVQFRFYDKSDGFAGAPRWFGNSSAAQSEDGRIWFIAQRGVTVIDPAKLPSGSVLLPVEIERIIADSRRIEGASSLRLPAGTSQVQIDYTMPTLTSPLKTRFRYRLEGFDANWVDAGTRRQALYTNLPPRQYRFRVQAGVGGDTSSESHADLTFLIAPHFYQTRWFMAACIGLLLMAGWGAWRFRLQQMHRQFALLFAERVRLGREIHDTLLQGLFGVGLQCEAIASDLGEERADLRVRLLQVQQAADEYVREARNSIRDLRSPKLQSVDLIGALRDSCIRLTDGTAVRHAVVVEGEPYRLSATAEEQLLRVSQEAVMNTVRHAQAAQLTLSLHYRPTSVHLVVADDGRGFDLPSSLKSGHCGIESMRERTKAVRGQFRLVSAVGKGTRVEVVLPRLG